ncbi:molybdopterin-dependent oxidoreductase [Streptomyces sp. NPDC056160]|uniref:molybdopterin-dependent oxidoreductase n=1 Tax=Streptomyces sp. NPDC056160 TaxID=3345731 RepID=UPI0035D7555F
MTGFSPGFRGRTHAFEGRLPPGQYPTESFPVLSAGPTPHPDTAQWSFTVTDETGRQRSWTWDEMMNLPQQEPTVHIHCVTRWSKFATRWRGVSLDVLLDDIDTAAGFVVAESY